jgi:WD40 repeat protein
MGIVYKARQPQLNRVVAVKVLAAGRFAAPDFVKRFRTEAETVASLDHPNIVPIYEVGEGEEQPFFSMKFVEGGSLAARISNRETQISDGDAARLMGKLARAVHYAHQRGVLHRDIKPGNVLLDSQGEPQLTDFGLAKLVEKESTLTRTMAMLGTPSYMSPEQARGEAKQLTTAVDVYGLGAVFYELLTGKPPFAEATTMETVRQVLEQEPRRPSSLKPGVDRDLETICLKCLEKDPARRYGSAEALGADLERWERDEPVVARPPSVLYQLQKSWRRNKLAYSAGLAVVLALVVGLGLAAAGWRQAGNERDTAVAARGSEAAQRRVAESAWAQAEQAQTLAAHERDLAQDRLYDSLVREARSIRIIRPLGYRRELMDRIRQAVAIPTAKRDTNVLRSEIAQCLGDALSLDPVDLVDPPRPASIFDFALNKDGTQMALATRDGHLLLYDTASGAIITRWEEKKPIVQLAFTSDGSGLFGRVEVPRSDSVETGTAPNLIEWRRAGDGSWSLQSKRSMFHLLALLTTKSGVVAAIEDLSLRQLRLVEVSTDRLVGAVPWARSGANPSAFTVSFDESLAAVTSEGETNQPGAALEIWDLATRQRRIRVASGPVLAHDLEFSPDAHFLACTSDSGVIVYDTFEFSPVSAHHGYVGTRATWAGATLAIPLSQAGAVRLYAVNSGIESARLTTRSQVTSVRTSRDGSVLVVGDEAGTLQAVHLGDTRERTHFIGHSGGVPCVEFSPDGKRVASTGKDETIRVSDFVTGKPIQVWRNPHVEGQTLSFSPDGRWLATGNYRNSQIVVWSLEDGERALVLGGEPPVGRATWSCAFSPDGKFLMAAGEGLRAWELSARGAGAAGPPLEARLLFNDAGYTRNLQFDPTGNRVAFEGTIQRGGEELTGSFTRGLGPEDKSDLADRHNWAVQTLAFVADGATLLNMDRDHTLNFWDLQSGKFVRKLSTLAAGESASTYVGNIRASPDGSKVAVANHNGLGANIYDLTSGKRRYSLPDEGGSIWWLAWHPDNRHLAVARGDGDISVWNLAVVESALAEAGLAP